MNIIQCQPLISQSQRVFNQQQSPKTNHLPRMMSIYVCLWKYTSSWTPASPNPVARRFTVCFAHRDNIWPRCLSLIVLLFSHLVVSDSFATPWTVAHQAPLSMGFPRQEYWRSPSPGGLPDLGVKPKSSPSAGGFITIEPPGRPLSFCKQYI